MEERNKSDNKGKEGGKKNDIDSDDELSRCLAELTIEDVEKPSDIAIEAQLATLSVTDKSDEDKDKEKELEKEDEESEEEAVPESNELLRSIEVTDEEELPLSAKFEELMKEIRCERQLFPYDSTSNHIDHRKIRSTDKSAKCLLFSQWTDTLDLAAKFLDRDESFGNPLLNPNRVTVELIIGIQRQSGVEIRSASRRHVEQTTATSN